MKVINFPSAPSPTPQKQTFEWARLHAFRKSQLEKHDSSSHGLSLAATANSNHRVHDANAPGLSSESTSAPNPVFNIDRNRYTQK